MARRFKLNGSQSWKKKFCKILYSNVQGLLSFQKCIDSQKLYLTGSYDLMLFCETWFDENVESIIIPNDIPTVLNRADRKDGSHGGVVICSNTLDTSPVKTKFDFGCAVVFHNCLVIVIYNPPLTTKYRVMDKHLLDFIKSVICNAFWSVEKNILVLGDFNILRLIGHSFPLKFLMSIPKFSISSFTMALIN